MGFLSPALLWGLTLLSVPIIIHLLNRRKFRVIDWAPMKYLRITLKRTKRRIRLEQLLLLLVRCAFVGLLIFAVTRPTILKEGLFSWASAGSKTSRLVLLDDTLSMGATYGEDSSFSWGRDATKTLIDSMSGGDALTILLASDPENALMEEVEVRQAADLDSVLDGLKLTDVTQRWSEVLEAASRKLMKSPWPVRELLIITDLRKEGWDDQVLDVATRLAVNDIKLRIVDVGGAILGNVALVEFQHDGGAVVPRELTRFRAVVRNDGELPFGPVSARISGSGSSRNVTIPEIDPGASTELVLDWRFEKPGVQSLSLELPVDALPGDNVRHCSVDVKETLTCLLVDGDPSDEPFSSETDYLSVAFTVGSIPWTVYVLRDGEWFGARPERVDLLILANVANIPATHAEWLEESVRDGMGLVLFPGEEIDLASTDQLLYRDGEGILPCSLADVRDDPAVGLVVESVQDSPLSVLAELAPEALAIVEARRYLNLSLNERDREDARVLAHWDNEDKTTAVVERIVGRGRVVVFGTSADREWTDWPIDPTWLLGTRSVGLHAAYPGASGLNQEAGQVLSLSTGAFKVVDARVRIPGGDQAEAMTPEKEEGDRHRIAWRKVRHAGSYEVSWTGNDGEEVQRVVAVSPVAAESRLERIEPSNLDALMGPTTPEIVHHSELRDVLEDTGQEIWRVLAWAALGFLALESFLMVFVGRRG